MILKNSAKVKKEERKYHKVEKIHLSYKCLKGIRNKKLCGKPYGINRSDEMKYKFKLCWF